MTETGTNDAAPPPEAALAETVESVNIAALCAADPILSHCPKQTLARVLPHIHCRELAPGELLIAAGDTAEYSYLLVGGALELTVADHERKPMLRGLVGQEAALGMDAYVLSARASSPTRLLCLPQIALEELLKLRFMREEFANGFAALLSDQARDAPVHEQMEEERHRIEAEAKKSKRGEEWRKLFGWLFALCVPIGVYYASEFTKLPNPESRFLLSVISATVVMWVFRLMPDFVPALFAVMAVALLGLAPIDVAFTGFSSSTLFMALSIFGLSAVITLSGLSYRILLWLLRLGPANKTWYFMSLFLSGAALSIMVPTANGRVAIITPFIGDLLASFDKEMQKSEAPRLTAAVLGGVCLLSSVFLSAKTVNFLVYGLMPIQEQARFQWLDWFISAAVFGGVLLVLYLAAAFTIFRSNTRPHIPKALVREQIRMLGSMSPAEWAGTLGLIVLLISFLTAKLHHIDIPWVALAILFSLLMFGFLSQTQFKRGVDWSFLVFLAALIGLVESIKYVKLDGWLESNLYWLVQFMQDDFALFVVVLYGCITLVRLALPINATVVVFATLLMPAAFAHGVTPWMVGFLILVMAEDFIWPYQASYYAQLVSMSRPHYLSDRGRILALNGSIYFLKVAAIYASIPYWKMLGLL